MQYLSMGFEICLPSLIIVMVTKQFPGFDVLKSPVMYIYFVFIILSTLRLNFLLSFLCGLLAAGSYITFCYCLYGHVNSNDTGRATLIVLSGVAAGLVARQIRAGIDNSIREAERRQRVENLFGQQLSAEVADKMLQQDGRLESKRMEVAIMFIDIRNFSAFACGRTPEEIVDYQNAFFSIIIRSVAPYNGIVQQFLGDGCMISFGAPVPLHNPAGNAVRAGLEILRQLEVEAMKGAIIPTRVGIGIHTGEAVTGNIGTSSRQQYSITGNVVIMAARIEQLNKEFASQMLVSADVIREIGEQEVVSRHYDNIYLKGFEQPVSVYQVA